MAIRNDRCAHTFMSAIHIAAAFTVWLKEWGLSLKILRPPVDKLLLKCYRNAK